MNVARLGDNAFMTLFKKCCTCQSVQAISEFNKRAAAKDGLQDRCRTCSRAWYLENKDEHIKNAYRRTKAQRLIMWGRLGAYLLEHPCVDCGEADLRTLEFDHRDRTDKVATVAQLISRGTSWETLLTEIEKCDVRCANCHRVRTSGQLGWWRTAAEAARREVVEAEEAAVREEVTVRLRKVLPPRAA